MHYLIVFAGAGLGGALRHAVNLAVVRGLGGALPLATLAINVLGSLAMGLLAGLAWSALGEGQLWRLFLATGFLGGFTTFSAFSLDAASMIERHEFGAAAAYAGASVLLSVLALFAGLAIARGGQLG